MKLSSTGATRSALRSPVRNALVTIQIALTLILLVGTLLLSKSLWRLTGTSLGFDSKNLLTFKIPRTGMGTKQTQATLRIEEILTGLDAFPGVISAGASSALPLGGSNTTFRVAIDGEVTPPPEAPMTPVEVVSPGYFRTLGTPLLAGREFDYRDGSDAPRVALLNETFVRLNLPGRDPVGVRLGLGGKPNITVVGVMQDVRDGNPGDDVRPRIYLPFAQAAPQIGWHTAHIAVRTSSDPLTFVETARKEILGIAKGATLYDFATMEDRLAPTVAPEWQRTVLFGLFSMIAVVLAAVGVYGSLSYSVALDRHQFGVRLALGSSREQLLGFVVRRSLRPVCLGVVLGLAGALALARMLAGYLYTVRPTDPTTYLIAAVVMIVISLLASGLPALRAMNADPLAVLRSE